ncbi:hypothetical protein FNF29_00681 [Cafeteria roenbergensis]|uniref:HSF-type DNA-binding domain-containing protein n=1 Tax=Cafeteria roenbergensis TaxID=33653 RepID=A0A5A8CWQ1_CAFRO|nr:hypothetical protein FNF29_00681 [Cafeteria roenbergensis]|eukprot:KAA0156570.1 hypothetical protein FNF29_00681 [Cafeteria roenbergensis]
MVMAMPLPGFVKKTWDILDRAEHQDLVSWSPAGDSILVHQPARFSSEILPNFFKHRNFSSFVRQLNLYSFRKTGDDPSCREFRHPLFRRDRPDLLPQIRRRTRKKGKAGGDDGSEPHDSPGFSSMPARADATPQGWHGHDRWQASQGQPPAGGGGPSLRGGLGSGMHFASRRDTVDDGRATGNRGSGDGNNGGDDRTSGGVGGDADDDDDDGDAATADRAGDGRAGRRAGDDRGDRAGHSGWRQGHHHGGPAHSGHDADSDDDDGVHHRSMELHMSASDGIEELREGRRDADRVLRRLVALSRRQNEMEMEMRNLKVQNAEMLRVAEHSRALQEELEQSRQRMFLLKRSMQRLYVLIWHMYDAFKAAVGPAGIADRPELAAIANAAANSAGLQDSMPGARSDEAFSRDSRAAAAAAAAVEAALGGGVAGVAPGGNSSPDALPSASPIATASEANETMPLSSFSRDGAYPFHEARQHWRTLSGPGKSRTSMSAAQGYGRLPGKRARSGEDSGDSGDAPDKRMALGDLHGFGSPRASPPMTDVMGPPPPPGPASDLSAPSGGMSTPSATSSVPMLVPYPAASSAPLGRSIDSRRYASSAPMPAASAALPAAVHSLGRAALSLADDQHAVMSTIATTEDRVRSAALALQLNPAPQVLNAASVRLARGGGGGGAGGYAGQQQRSSWASPAEQLAPTPTGPLSSPAGPVTREALPVTSAPMLAPSSGSAVSPDAPQAAAPSWSGARAPASLSLSIGQPPAAAAGEYPTSLARSFSGASQSSNAAGGQENYTVALAGIGFDGFGAPELEPAHRSMLRNASGSDEARDAPPEDDDLDALSLGSLGSLDEPEDDGEAE